jgi:hypothetical protein
MTTRAAGPARHSKKPRGRSRPTTVMVGLAVAAGIARDPRTQRAVIMAVIMAAAAVTALRENQQRSVARLAAWDKRQAEKAKELAIRKARQARAAL